MQRVYVGDDAAVAGAQGEGIVGGEVAGNFAIRSAELGNIGENRLQTCQSMPILRAETSDLGVNERV